MRRPSFQDIYMDFACSIAKRSTCSRLSVGCVITSEDFRYVYGIGYNGNASGLPNKCDSLEEGGCGCLHSEENAIINCCAPRNENKIVFVTHAPCKMCAKRLINLGNVKAVYFKEFYRKREGLQLLIESNIKVQQWPPQTDQIPDKTYYCYDSNGMCPHWFKNPHQDQQESGYCTFLGEGDWQNLTNYNFLCAEVQESFELRACDENGFCQSSLLWDQCKECCEKEGLDNEDDEFWQQVEESSARVSKWPDWMVDTKGNTNDEED